MFTPTVTLSLEQYDMQRAMVDEMSAALERARREADEAREEARKFLLNLFEVKYYNLEGEEEPTIYLRCAPGLVDIVNEVLAANPNPTGTIFAVETQDVSMERYDAKYVGFSYKKKFEEVEEIKDGE